MAQAKRIEKLVDEIAELTLMETADLVANLKEKLNIKDTPMMAAMPFPAQSAAEAPAKTEFDVILVSVGDKKLDVIKEVKNILSKEDPTLTLAAAKTLVESAPQSINKAMKKDTLSKDAAEKIKKQLEDLGAKVELK
jgi:large subunit ribosomal protein L7/L12